MEKSDQITADEFFGMKGATIDPVKLNVLKQFIGNNKTTFNTLSSSDTKALFDLILLCDKIPHLPPSTDHAIERNLEIIKFQSDFKNESDNKRKMDESEEINKRSKN